MSLPIVAFWLVSALSSCSVDSVPSNPLNPDANDQSALLHEVVIFSVNDVHGRIDNFAKIKPILEAANSEYQSVYFVSAGDLFSGNPIVDFHPEKGYPLIDLLSKTGLDVNVLGNHEFDYGQEALTARVQQASFDFICSNVEPGAGSLEDFPDYTVIQKGPVKIAFVGVVETGSRGGYPLTHPKKIEGLGSRRQ
jgi:5''-nucleotidase/2'',3''-cyclic phosphodiesterase and related esterases